MNNSLTLNTKKRELCYHHFAVNCLKNVAVTIGCFDGPENCRAYKPKIVFTAHALREHHTNSV